jgi:hypothetical protein
LKESITISAVSSSRSLENCFEVILACKTRIIILSISIAVFILNFALAEKYLLVRPDIIIMIKNNIGKKRSFLFVEIVGIICILIYKIIYKVTYNIYRMVTLHKNSRKIILLRRGV